MRPYRWVTGIGAVLLLGCGDRPGPVLSAAPQALGESAIAPDGGEVPSYESEASVPPEYRWAEVLSHRERVGWDANTVTGYGSMEYFGNRGLIELDIHILHEYSTVATTRTAREQSDFWPARRVMGIPLSYTVPKECGQTANLLARYTARTVLFVDTRISEIGPHTLGGDASGAQPACPEPEPCVGEGGEYVTSVSPAPAPGANAAPDGYLYDPYDPGYGSSTTSDCPGTGGGSSGSESGQTFPEMCSSMGGHLYYDYGCIEKYNKDTGSWETIWCGTYVVCET